MHVSTIRCYLVCSTYNVSCGWFLCLEIWSHCKESLQFGTLNSLLGSVKHRSLVYLLLVLGTHTLVPALYERTCTCMHVLHRTDSIANNIIASVLYGELTNTSGLNVRPQIEHGVKSTGSGRPF